MCITFARTDIDGRFPIVVALNRDENPQRQTAPLNQWSYENDSFPILGGQDLESQGTWFGYSKERFVVLTNRRRRSESSQAAWEGRRRHMEQLGQLSRHSIGARRQPAPAGNIFKSRGLLVCDVLKDGYEFANNQKDELYRPFNLLLGSLQNGLVHVSEDNLHSGGTFLAGESVYAMTNADDMNPPWPKAVRGKQLFEQVLNHISPEDTAVTLANKLFQHVLLDAKQFPLEEQPKDERAQGDDVATLTCPIFIPKNKVWHTLSSTVLIIDRDKVATVVEWSHPTYWNDVKSPTKIQIVSKTD